MKKRSHKIILVPILMILAVIVTSVITLSNSKPDTKTVEIAIPNDSFRH